MVIQWLRRLTRKSFSRKSSDVSNMLWVAAIPALFTRIEGGPTSLRIAAAVSETEDEDVMSHL